jgi:hypothetical protein
MGTEYWQKLQLRSGQFEDGEENWKIISNSIFVN